MSKSAHFKVDPKLAQLLGESYRNVEEAAKELIDNAYDADAENVTIMLPKELDDNPKIIIIDDGSGMVEQEVREEYLNIANSRFVRKGKLSLKKKRKVKGRKGIGKFAGLMIAEEMTLETQAKGIKTKLTISKHALAKVGYDLEKVPLPIETEKCPQTKHGTAIILSGLNQNFFFPNPERLKEMLMRDYGREADFTIIINGERIGVLDLKGQSYSEKITLPGGKKATLNYTITNKQIKNSGLSLRVDNRLVGRPKNFLANDEIIPKKLQGRVYGEIICDDLSEETTADHGAIFESSKTFQKLNEKVTGKLRKSVDEVFATDMKMARARYQRKINSELAKLPEYKQPYAKKALVKVLEKFYGESEERISSVISVTVAAMEKDHYWDIINNIQETGNSDIEKFADALSEFGLLEMSIISSQALNRLRFLDELSILINDPKTTEATVHKAIENSTWILGDDYSVLFSDTNLKTALEKVLKKKYKGKNPKNRPDLLLGRKFSGELLLIEFKKPSITLNRKTELQAIEYRDELNAYFNNQKIEVILLGGKVKQNISSHNQTDDILYRTYIDIISVAKQKLEWLLNELNNE